MLNSPTVMTLDLVSAEDVSYLLIKVVWGRIQTIV